MQDIMHSLVFDNTKLQTLDRRVGKDNLYFDKEMFQASLKDWENIPVIFQKDGRHPADFAGVKADPEKAAEAVGGRMVGRVHNPRIVIEGGPRLMATLSIDGNETEIERLWQSGILFPSTAFSTHSDGDKITSPPIPNHVLIFPIRKDRVVPGDFGAYVNSQEIEQMTEETTLDADNLVVTTNSKKMPFSQYLKSIFSSMTKHREEGEKDVVAEEIPPVPETAAASAEDIAEQPQDVPAAGPVEPEDAAEKEEAPEPMPVEEEKEDLTHTMDALRAELEQYKHAEQEAKFEKLLHALPVGMTQTEEQRAAVREQYEHDLEGLLFSVLENKSREGTTEKAGVQFIHSEYTTIPYTTVGDLSLKKRDEL